MCAEQYRLIDQINEVYYITLINNFIATNIQSKQTDASTKKDV